MIESSASEENDESSRNKKEAGIIPAQNFIPSPFRRHHLKFGVLGKRHSFGYLGKRTDGMRKKMKLYLHIYMIYLFLIFIF